MNDQFDNLFIPDPFEAFYHSSDIQSIGFTHLMKLALMTKYEETIDIIKEIITNNPEEINRETRGRFGVLSMACRNSSTHSSTSIVKLLLNAAADPNTRSTYGSTALMRASEYSNSCSSTSTVKLLLDAKADPNLSDTCGQTALMRALASLNTMNSNIPTIQLLLEAKANPNLQDEFGNTSLIDVCSRTNSHYGVPAIKLLLNANANPNIQNNNGYTALRYLLSYGNLNDVELLTELIIQSQKSIPADGSFYNIYLQRNVNILDDYIIRILKGEIVINRTKSARN